MEGDYINYFPENKKAGNKRMLIETIETEGREAEVIKRKHIPEIMSDENIKIIANYFKCVKYGLPYTGNKWALEPCIIMDIIWTLDNESALIKKHRSKPDGN